MYLRRPSVASLLVASLRIASLRIARRRAARRLAAAVTATLSAAVAPAAFAHPGDHGSSTLAAIAHLLSDPYHLLLAFAAIGAVALVRRTLRSRASARPAPRRRED